MTTQPQVAQTAPTTPQQSRRFDLRSLVEQWRPRPAPAEQPPEKRPQPAAKHSLVGLSAPQKRVSLKLIQGGQQLSSVQTGSIDDLSAGQIISHIGPSEEELAREIAQRELQQQLVAQNKRELMTLSRMSFPAGKTQAQGIQLVQRYLELAEIRISDFYVINEAAMLMAKTEQGVVFGNEVIVSVLDKVDTAEDGRVPTIIGKAIGLGIFSATDETGVPYEHIKQLKRVVRIKNLQLSMTPIGRKYLADAYRLRAKMWQSLAGRTLAMVEAIMREESSDSFPDLLALTDENEPSAPQAPVAVLPQEWFPTHWPTRVPPEPKRRPNRRRGTGKQTGQPDAES
jgi:hypothetical protein